MSHAPNARSAPVLFDPADPWRGPGLRETPSQTAGPYVHIGLIPEQAGFHAFERNVSGAMRGGNTRGEPIAIEGRVLDGAGAPCRDILLELWQADANGIHDSPADPRFAERDPHFRGFGRTGTHFETGLFRFDTIKPGRVPGRRGFGHMAPHASLWLVARGINVGLSTRIYFDDEGEANAADPVLNLVDPPSRRDTLLAKRGARGGETIYTFDIHLQGPDETVFFDV